MTRSARAMFVGVFSAILGAAACGDDIILATYNLEIGPSPASPGDELVASFNVDLVPTQAHTIVIHIDGTEHLRVNSSDQPAIPIVLELGDAADLIATYGVGQHVAHVEVIVTRSNRSAESQSALFELEEDTP